MANHIDDLKNSLSQHLLEAPYDPSGYTSTHKDIDAAAQLVREMDVGDVEPEQVVEAFKELAPGFDFMSYFMENVERGIYDMNQLEQTE